MSGIGQLAAEFETLVRQKKQAAAAEASFTEQIASVERRLLDAMADEGLQSVNLESGMTLYKRCDKYYGVAKGCKREQLIEALANCDLTRSLVQANVNLNTLRSRMNEIEAAGESIPEELSRMMKVTEKYKVGYNS